MSVMKTPHPPGEHPGSERCGGEGGGVCSTSRGEDGSVHRRRASEDEEDRLGEPCGGAQVLHESHCQVQHPVRSESARGQLHHHQRELFSRRGAVLGLHQHGGEGVCGVARGGGAGVYTTRIVTQVNVGEGLTDASIGHLIGWRIPRVFCRRVVIMWYMNFFPLHTSGQ
jgi:hypothetical protein